MKRLITSVLAFAGAVCMATAAHAQPAATQCPPFEMIGEGPDLVLVPGLGSAPAVWDGVRDSLAQDYRVHLVHVAGFAGREANGDPDTIVERTRGEIITHLDCQGVASAAYAGHSMGGFLGLTLAASHPDRINTLVVVDALPFFSLIFSPQATPESVVDQAKGARAAILQLSDEEFSQSQSGGVHSLVKNTDYHDTVVGWSVASDRATFAGAMYSLMTTDVRPDLPTITTPTTIIAASNAFAPKARIETLYGGAYQALEGAQLRIIEDSYHFIMFDQPDAFEAELRRALSETGG